MSDFVSIISMWPSVKEFADDIGVPRTHAHTMKARRSIPVRYWPAVVAAAKKRGLSVTYERLAKKAVAS